MRFAVIDTETTWGDKVMSIGVVISDEDTKKEVVSKYYIITPEFRNGGMFSYTLNDAPQEKTFYMTRKEAIKDLVSLLGEKSVNTIFAYNANFDYKHLPELRMYKWVDIMKIAAYRQYNHFIPRNAECCGKCEILTGVPKPRRGIITAGDDKINWVRRLLSEDIKVNIVWREDKPDYCTDKGCILLDDYELNIKEWEKCGGTGIHFVDANSALEIIKKLEKDEED